MAASTEQNPAPTHPKPIVVVSQCLGFAAVRYNGVMLQDDFVHALRNHVEFVQVCPEVGIGLGVPRDPIRIVLGTDGPHLVQPATGLDLTAKMRQFSRDWLDQVGPVDGFILKSRSPSCGVKDVKAYNERGSPMPKSRGLFATAVMERYPIAAVEDDGRLTNSRLRHHFLVRVYAHARFRQVQAATSMASLVGFHTAYKLQLMAYSQAGLKELGRMVANPRNLPLEKVLGLYLQKLAEVLANPARAGAIRNALLHAFGYVSAQLNARERKHFLEMVEEYRHQRLGLAALLTLLESWVVRFAEPYLADQLFFQPYPRALLSLSDSGGTPGA